MSKVSTKTKKTQQTAENRAETPDTAAVDYAVTTAKLSDLIPDDKNFNRGTEFGQHLIEKSLRENGAGRSILLDKNNRIIAGNKTAENAAAIDLDDVVIVETDGTKLVAVKRTDIDLDSEQGRKMALADNATSAANLDWDKDALKAMEDEFDFDSGDWGVDFSQGTEEESEEEMIERKEREFRARMEAGELDEDDEEYQEFLEKFKNKKTTDDCYTPDIVYNALARWVMDEYNISKKNFERPFYPGGDYKKHIYPKGCVVVDNPPFSILAEILQFYKEKNIKFFLFAPTLTLFSSSSSSSSTALPVGVGITYENGASVNTSFLTNLEPKEIRLRSVPSLYKVLNEANDENLAQTRKELPKYTYPDNIVTSSAVARFSKYGVNFLVKVKESESCSAMDEQKEKGKTIYGNGYYIGEKAAAEKAAAEKAAAEKAAAEKAAAEKAAALRWHLSEREKEIIKKLS